MFFDYYYFAKYKAHIGNTLSTMLTFSPILMIFFLLCCWLASLGPPTWAFPTCLRSLVMSTRKLSSRHLSCCRSQHRFIPWSCGLLEVFCLALSMLLCFSSDSYSCWFGYVFLINLVIYLTSNLLFRDQTLATLLQESSASLPSTI